MFLKLALIAGLLWVPPVHAAVPNVTDVSFVGSGGVVLHGSIVSPPGPADARLPGVVMLSGAGGTGQSELMPEAEAFARHGVVSLVYDKRTVGYSLFHRDYSVLADDALAAVRVLRARSNVDPAKVGLWALSEGAFVAPLVAERSTDVTFVITVGAVGVTPAEQTAWSYGEFLGHDGVSGSLVHMMQSTATRVMVGAGLFPEANFDPLAAWAHVRQPVLAQWGQLDRQSVPVQSSQLIGQALRRAGNDHYTVRFVPGARHDLNLTADGGFDRTTDLSADYGQFEAAWIADPATPVTTSAAPTQDARSQPVTPLAWYESPAMQAAAIVLFLVAFAGYPLTAAARRLLGRRGRPVVTARWLAAIGLTTTIAFVGYLFFMLATAANLVGPVVLGSPVPWLVLQVLAVVTVVATAATAVRWWRHHRDLARFDHVRLGLLVAAGAVFLPWALYWGLLTP